MREMKNSNTEWLECIPQDWALSNIGALYSMRNTKVSDRDYQPLSVTMKGVVPQLETAAKSDAHDDRKLVKKGDFAINSRSDRRGSCGIADRDGSVSLINTILAPRSEMNPDYYNWLFHTSQFADEFYRWGHGIVDDLWTTRWQEMKKIEVPIPNCNEQEKIADYLDTACGKVDALIANQQAQIEKLKAYKQSLITETVTHGLNPDAPMKDSGVEWIGMIPEGWEVIRGKFALKLMSRPTMSTDDVITCFRDGEVTLRKNRREEGFTFSDKEIGYQGIEPGDLVIHGMDGFAGAIGISDSRGKGSPVLIVCDSKNNKKYLAYYLRNLAYRNIFVALATGIRVRSCDLRWNKLSVLPFVLPPISEQQQIADYLDNKCAKINALIAIKQQKIEKLTQYKKSLIYEYVTGKKEA